MKALVVGFGSYQADDQVGWLILDRLQALASLRENVSFIKISGNAMTWLSQMRPEAQLIFVDAVCSGRQAGYIHQFELTPGTACLTGSFSSHGLGLMESLELAQSLNLLARPGLFYGIEVEELNPLISISPQVAEAVPVLSQKIENYLLSDVTDLV